MRPGGQTVSEDAMLLYNEERSPFGAGMPNRPAIKVVTPSKKKSQWNPGGFFNGNSEPCAMRDYTTRANVSSNV